MSIAVKPKTTVLLGAGFSYAVTEHVKPLNLPLSKDIFHIRYMSASVCTPFSGDTTWYLPSRKEIYPLTKILTDSYRAVFDEELGWVDPVIQDEQGRPANINFQLLYSHIQAEIGNPIYSLQFQTILKMALAQLSWYIKRVLSSYAYLMSEELPLIKTFWEFLPTPSNVFSLNFDDLIDSITMYNVASKEREFFGQLQDIAKSSFDFIEGEEIEYGSSLEKSNGYWKLHGGINWAFCSNENCLKYHFPWYSSDWYSLSYPPPCKRCGSPTEIGILAPTTMKDYAKRSIFFKTLRHFYESIRNSDTIVIVGYSFADYDSTIYSWLKYGMTVDRNRRHEPSIVVVDPDHERIQGIAGTLTHSENVLGFESIEEFVESGYEFQSPEYYRLMKNFKQQPHTSNGE